jgi:hypothetical protein
MKDPVRHRMRYRRNLSACPLPGDVACFLARHGHDITLDQNEENALSAYLDTNLRSISSGATSGVLCPRPTPILHIPQIVNMQDPDTSIKGGQLRTDHYIPKPTLLIQVVLESWTEIVRWSMRLAN